MARLSPARRGNRRVPPSTAVGSTRTRRGGRDGHRRPRSPAKASGITAVVRRRPRRRDHRPGEGSACCRPVAQDGEDVRIAEPGKKGVGSGVDADLYIGEDRNSRIRSGRRELIGVAGRVEGRVEGVVGPQSALVVHPRLEQSDIVRRGHDRETATRTGIDGADDVRGHLGLGGGFGCEHGHRVRRGER